MSPANCAVVGCTNSTYRLKKWLDGTCETHHVMNKECSCEPPFRLYMFPSEERNKGKRETWIKKMRRQKADKSEWDPRPSDRVCSDHFVDKIPTTEHPAIQH